MTDATGQVAAIIPAAGSGNRLGSAKPKAFVELAGLSLLARSALTLSAIADVIIVAAPEDFVQAAARELENVDAQIHIVAGGENRQDSVAAALRVLPEDVQVVLVHDAARPLVPLGVVESVVNKVRDGAKAVVPVLPLVDTIKRINPEDEVIETIDRSQLRRVQTPQGFSREVIEHAYSDPTHVATDDAGLVESLGVAIATVPGSELSLKITNPDDVVHALSLLERAQ